jgi:gliding motility-associated-like protein
MNWFWDFGNQESSSSQGPSYVYPEEGTYRVKLTATSNKGCIDSVARNVIIFGLPDVSFTHENVCLFSDMRFTNTSVGSPTVDYIWDFGDGTQIQAYDTIHRYSNWGTYTVTLKALSLTGGIDSVQRTVQVYPRSQPAFSFDNVCEGQSASFTNLTQSPTPYLTYNWDFGNGATDQRTDPSTSYAEANRYPVKLIVTTNDGCTDSITKYIFVNPNPLADFAVVDIPYQQPSIFQNETSIDYGNLTYLWEFGDESSSDTLHPIYYYESPGVYQVRLTASSDSGCVGMVQKAHKIFDLPVVNFSSENVCIGDSMIFINESTIPSGTLSFDWDFNDGGSSTLINPSYLFNAPGIYNVRLISISSFGARDTIWKEVKVFDKPVVNYTFTEACDGYTTWFENQSEVSDGGISGVLWDFGDGSNSVQQNPGKDFLNPGIYPVTLEITSTTGCINSFTENVIVHHNPIADFSVDPVCHYYTSEFVNTSSIDNSDRPYTLVYQWNFDDGQVTTDHEPDHRYSDAGGYQVQLIVSSDAGCYDTLYRLAQVYPLPDAFAGNDTTVEKGFPVTIEATGGEFYEWSPQEGLSDALLSNPEARPMETTSYIVRATDANNCFSFDTMIVTVEDAMRIIPSNILTPNNKGENDYWNIINIDSYPMAEITIFDRWGKVVFETEEYRNDWQGVNFNGDILPDGTYYYVILLSREHNVVYKGAITILRDK